MRIRFAYLLAVLFLATPVFGAWLDSLTAEDDTEILSHFEGSIADESGNSYTASSSTFSYNSTSPIIGTQSVSLAHNSATYIGWAKTGSLAAGTVEVYFRPTSFAYVGHVLSIEHTYDYLKVSVQTDGTLSAGHYDNNDVWNAIDNIKGTVLQLGEIYHIAYTWGPTGQHLYINGVEEGNSTWTNAMKSTNRWVLGHPWSSRYPAVGDYDEYRLSSTQHTNFPGPPQDSNQDACENNNNVWFTGNVTGNYPYCCGDDGSSDDFYNGSLASTNTFCYLGFFSDLELDASQSLCEHYNFEWIGSVLGGINSSCCGDDSTSDDFYNNSASCIDAQLYHCGVSDGICPEDVNASMTCSPSDPDCGEGGYPDNRLILCENDSTTWNWFSNYRGGESPYCCGNNGTDDDFLGLSDCCYNGHLMESGNTTDSLYCLNGFLYDCNNQISDFSDIDNNAVTCDVKGSLFCTENNTWQQGVCSNSGLDVVVNTGLLVSGDSVFSAIDFTLTNPTDTYRTYNVGLSYDSGYSHFTTTKNNEMTITLAPNTNFTSYIDVFPTIIGEISYTLTVTNINDPTDYSVSQFSINVISSEVAEGAFDVYTFDEITIFEIIVSFLNQFFVLTI